MIWHFLEVWLLLGVLFAVGCVLGAYTYRLVAATGLAPAQGFVADRVGDGLDRLKARLGLGPAWRPVHFRRAERAPRAMPTAAEPPDYDVIEHAPYAEPVADLAPAAEVLLPPADEMPAPKPRLGRRRKQPPQLLPPQTPHPEADEDLLRAVAATPVAPPARRVSPPPAIRPYVHPKRPAAIATPRGGVPDNLQRIKGIGKRNESRLNELGIFHFGQIAAWTPGEVRWIGEELELAEDRIERDAWIAQATVLAMGTATGFEKSAERRRQRRRQQREFQARMTTATIVPEIHPPRVDPDVAEPSAADDGVYAPEDVDTGDFADPHLEDESYQDDPDFDDYAAPLPDDDDSDPPR